MKRIINISLGISKDDYDFKTKFLKQNFHIKRFGTDGNLERAADMLLKWNKKADAISLSNIKFPYTLGSSEMMEDETKRLHELGLQMQTPVTAGDAMRTVIHEWAIRHLQFKMGNNYFDNTRVFFFSGLVNSTLAHALSDYTNNLVFADPILEHGIPRFLNSMKDLELFAKRIHGILQLVPSKGLLSPVGRMKIWNEHSEGKTIKDASIIVVPYYDFYRYMDKCTVEELLGKIIITSTAYDDRISFLKERGVDTIIDTTPKILKRVVGMSVLEAMSIAALEKPQNQVTNDDLLEIISDQRMEPRITYLSGKPRRVNRFAFITCPPSVEYLKKIGTINLLSKVTPPAFMDTAEKVLAYAPPSVYTTIKGIKSPTGIEAEGWLINLGTTPEEMMKHSPEFVSRRLLHATQTAKKLGAQIVGIGLLPKEMASAMEIAAKRSEIPVTTGNSYTASAALWAAADAVRRMGLIKLEKGKILKAKTMVVGATGAVGEICCRLLAKAFQEVHMVGRNMAKLLALLESINAESPEVDFHISTNAEKYLGEMDVIVTASSGARKNIDIMKVKPGCIITDVTLPLIFSPEDAAKRPDVLIIKSGEVLLPGKNVRMKDIGLPPKVTFAGLAETIILALEGRYEWFTVGSETEWEKVREIYRLGHKHGMKLAAISGVTGVISEEDIARVKENALNARKNESK